MRFGARGRALAVAACVTHASFCYADEPAGTEKGGLELAGLVGYGTSGRDADILGVGVGARVGYSAKSRWYVGLLGNYHFGSHDELEPDVRHSSRSLRAELGYDVPIFPLILRPSLRAGFTGVTTPRDVDGGFTSPDIGLGATLLVRVDGPFLGVDAEARALTRPVENGDNIYTLTTVAVYAVGGYRF